jgi:hypothetical protein
MPGSGYGCPFAEVRLLWEPLDNKIENEVRDFRVPEKPEQVEDTHPEAKMSTD